MQLKRFIETYFEIDDAKTGELVPFKFNKVQQKYYAELQEKYGIEQNGLTCPIREDILKARREGFSSLILALFAADDILQENPTQTSVISYKDDATKVFRRRYKNYILAYFKNRWGLTDESQIFKVDSGNELILAHNGARFFCGTASARTAERGGVLQKLLFSEHAHYPDTEVLTAKEIVEGTLRQVDIHAGWVFKETTANGYGNHHEQSWTLAIEGKSRFRPVFYGWQEFYTSKDFEIICSEFTDKAMIKQEYPSTWQEAFLHTGSPFFDNEQIFRYMATTTEPIARGEIMLNPDKTHNFEELSNGELLIWEYPQKGSSYVLGGDTAEGLIDGDWNVAKVINNRTLRTAASLRTHASPDQFEKMVFALGVWYNEAYIAVEANKDGLWVNTELFNDNYPNLYFREEIDNITLAVKKKVGWLTTAKTRPVILSELRKTLNQVKDCWNDKGFLEECLTFVRADNGRPEAMSGKNDDQIIALAIVLEVRRNAPASLEVKDTTLTPLQESIIARLEARYGKKVKGISQRDFV